MDNLFEIYYEVLRLKCKQVQIFGVTGWEEKTAKELAKKLNFKFSKKESNEEKVIILKKANSYQKPKEVEKLKNTILNRRRLVIFMLPPEFEEEQKLEQKLYSELIELDDKLIMAYDNIFDLDSFKNDLSFDEITHSYIQNGVNYESATTCVDKIINERINFLGLSPEQFANIKSSFKIAGERGNLIHRAIQGFYNFDRRQAPPAEHANFWNWFLRWDKQFKPNVKFVEKRFIDKKLGFSGTVDFVGKINDIDYIIDWKTQSVPTLLKWKLQLHFYYLGLINNKYIKNKNIKLGVLHIRGDFATFYKCDIDNRVIELIELYLKLNNNKKEIELNDTWKKFTIKDN